MVKSRECVSTKRCWTGVIYGDVKNSIYNTSVYFKNAYELEWVKTDLAKEIIKDVDSSEVVSGGCISSPVFGLIPPERLSGGTKTLLLIWNEENQIFNASTCGDNCAKWILEIGKSRRYHQFASHDELWKG